MADLALIVGIESLRRTNSSVCGGIYLRLNEAVFPSLAWDDFVVPFVSAWIFALLRLRDGYSQHEQVRFMEGPFFVDLSNVGSAGKKEIIVALVEDRLKVVSVEASATVDLDRSVTDSLKVAETILAACRLRGWDNADVRELAGAEASSR